MSKKYVAFWALLHHRFVCDKRDIHAAWQSGICVAYCASMVNTIGRIGCVVLFTGWFHRCIRLEHSDASLMHRWNQPVNKTTHPYRLSKQRGCCTHSFNGPPPCVRFVSCWRNCFIHYYFITVWFMLLSLKFSGTKRTQIIYQNSPWTNHSFLQNTLICFWLFHRLVYFQPSKRNKQAVQIRTSSPRLLLDKKIWAHCRVLPPVEYRWGIITSAETLDLRQTRLIT